MVNVILIVMKPTLTKKQKEVLANMKEKRTSMESLNSTDKAFLRFLVENHFVVLDCSDKFAEKLRVDDRRQKLAINQGTRVFLTALLAKLQG